MSTKLIKIDISNKDKLFLSEIVNKKFEPFKINTNVFGGKYHYEYLDVPRVRTLTKVITRKEKGCTWLEWHWIPEYCELRHERDVCGFSGYMIYDKEGKESELRKFKDMYFKC